jgi:hypothetical protein
MRTDMDLRRAIEAERARHATVTSTAIGVAMRDGVGTAQRSAPLGQQRIEVSRRRHERGAVDSGSC